MKLNQLSGISLYAYAAKRLKEIGLEGLHSVFISSGWGYSLI